MKATFCLLYVALISMCPGSLLAQQPDGDPLQDYLIPPELLMQNHAEIGLTEQQLQPIRVRLESIGPKVERRHARQKDAMNKLIRLLAAEKVDEAAALKQLDEALSIERDLKRTHLQLMIQIRNELSREQLQIVAKLRQNGQVSQH